MSRRHPTLEEIHQQHISLTKNLQALQKDEGEYPVLNLVTRPQASPEDREAVDALIRARHRLLRTYIVGGADGENPPSYD